MKSNQFYLLTILFLLMAPTFSCRKNEATTQKITEAAHAVSGEKAKGFAENDMVMYWNEKTNLVLSAPMTSPARSRYFAIIQIAVHDAMNSIKPKFQRFALLNAREKFASPDAAVASAAYWAIKGLGRQGSFPVDTWLAESLETLPNGESKTLGVALGKAAAEAIINKKSNDGFTQVLATSVNPPNGTTPGAYRQTNTLNVRFVPNWGTVLQPYVTTSNSQFRPAGPYGLSSAEYAADYNEVKEKGARSGSTRTSEEQQLAIFWGDNRPSYLWNNFAREVVKTKKLDAWRTARLFAAMHTAIADGFNTVLEAAYHFYFWRPETAIREGNNDGNNATVANATWIPNLIETIGIAPAPTFVSPPVPEYPSGYTMIGGVTAEILQAILGTDKTSINMTSPRLPGVTLHYSSIAQAARDNTNAKIYAGWQFRKSVEDGEALGRQIAAYILNNSFQSANEN